MQGETETCIKKIQIQKGYRYVLIWTFRKWKRLWSKKKMKTSKKITTNIQVSKEDLAGTKSTNYSLSERKRTMTPFFTLALQ